MSKRILIAIVAAVLTTLVSWGYGNVERIVNVKDPSTAKLYERFFAPQQQKPDRGEKTMDKKSGVRHENDGEDETTSTITLHYTMPEGYRLNTIIVYYEEYYQIYDERLTGEGDYEINVPAGNYELLTQFSLNNNGGTDWRFVIVEGLDASSDITVNVHMNQADKHIRLTPKLHDGSTPSLGIFQAGSNSENPYDGASWDYANANTASFIGTLNIRRRNWNNAYGINYIIGKSVKGFGERDSQGEREVDFYINSLSDNYYLYMPVLIHPLSDDSTPDFVTFVAPLSESLDLTNTAADFKLFQTDIPRTKISEGRRIDEFRSKFEAAMNLYEYGNEILSGAGGFVNGNENLSINVAALDFLHDPAVYALPAFKLGRVDFHERDFIHHEDEFGEWDQQVDNWLVGIETGKIYLNGDKWEFVKANNSTNNVCLERIPGGNGFGSDYPGHPSFFFDSEKQMPRYGNSTPILSFVTQINRRYFESGAPGIYPVYEYVGRYGEFYSGFKTTGRAKVLLNDEKMFEGANGIEFENFLFSDFAEKIGSGKVKIELENDLAKVDDLTGVNHTEVTMNFETEDCYAPSMQMLQFIDNSTGLRNDRFAKAVDGVMEFTAADFNGYQVGSGLHNWFDVDPVSVKVEYAPYGTDGYVPLEVEEDESLLYIPVFGHFYRASLSGIDRVSENGWYDLRFTLEDNAGNSAVQTVSPAFKIEDMVGVSSAVADNGCVVVRDGVIYAYGEDVRAMEVYSLDGRKIASANAPQIDMQGAKGVYIVKTTADDGSASSHKLIIR